MTETGQSELALASLQESFDIEYADPQVAEPTSESFVEIILNKAYEISTAPYKHQILQKYIEKAGDESSAASLLKQLTEFGIDVYVIPYDAVDIFGTVRDVCKAASDKNPMYASNYQCCLFKDGKDRLFNLVIAGGSSATATAWTQVDATFSATKAIIAIVFLSRNFSCLAYNYGWNPTVIALVLGLVCRDEMQFVAINSCIHVQGHPSVGAYAIMQPTNMDWPYKLVLFMLAIAPAISTANIKIGITWFGVFLAVYIMAANVGSRAWRNMCFQKQRYSGPLYMVIASLKAFAVGVCFPYFGSRGCEPGGRTALVNTLQTALIVALVFFLSGFWTEFNKALIITTQEESFSCGQEYVYIVVGSWYTMSLLACVCFYKRIIPDQAKEIPESSDREPLLVRDWSSPVGFKVPNFPDYALDPAHDFKPIKFCSEKCDVLFGVLLALVLGGAIVAWGLFD